MMSVGSAPFCTSLNTSILFVCVLSTAAWHAATPLPGTTTACTPFRKSSSPLTHVAEAITTRPVARSTATTDQVANARDGVASTSRMNAIRRMGEDCILQRMTNRNAILLSVLCVVGVLCGNGASAQPKNPRIGTWKMKSDAQPPAQNLMIYEPYGQGGMRITVDNTSANGRKAHWTYVTMFDGKDKPVEGAPNAHAT